MNERGFTLVELLVAVTISLVVFGLVGTSLVTYQRNADRSTRQNNSQDQARLAVDRIVAELRDAASLRDLPTLIESAGPYDLVFQTIGPAPGAGSQNESGIRRVRYCLPPDPGPGSEANAVLYAQTQTWTTVATPANPWPITSGGSTACPSTPGSVPSGSSIATTKLAEDVMNRYAGGARAAFSYDATALSAITTVGIDVSVDVDPDQSPDATSLRSAAFLRNQNQAPVASFTATPTGGGHVLLNGGGSSDPDNQQITYAWHDISGGSPSLIGSSGLVDWVPPGGPGTYEIRLTVTDTGGLTSAATRTVAVS